MPVYSPGPIAMQAGYYGQMPGYMPPHPNYGAGGVVPYVQPPGQPIMYGQAGQQQAYPFQYNSQTYGPPIQYNNGVPPPMTPGMQLGPDALLGNFVDGERRIGAVYPFKKIVYSHKISCSGAEVNVVMDFYKPYPEPNQTHAEA